MVVICIRVVVEFSWFGLVHEERPADRFARQCVLVHGIVNVLDQTVPQLDILTADGRDGLRIPVGLLVRLVVVVIVVAEPRKESSHDGPASKHLWIHDLTLPCCAEATDVAAGHRLSRQTDPKDQRNIHLNEFPIGRAVPCPQAGVAMDPHEASTSDDIVAFGGLEAFKSLVSSFTQVVVV